jgi:ribosome-associated protein
MTNSNNTIELGKFLKWAGVVQTGGEAKILIQAGRVKVNDEIEKRRGRKLVEGDRVFANNQTFTVELS